MNMDTYKTKDLAEAAYLLTKGKSISEINRINKICWFVFSDKKDCEELANEFWFGNSLVVAKLFYDSIQTLKNRIFSK